MIEGKKVKKKILPQMFDIRPVDENGDLDFGKIGKVKKVTGSAHEDGSWLAAKKNNTNRTAVIMPKTSGKIISEIRFLDNSKELEEIERRKELVTREKETRERMILEDRMARTLAEQQRRIKREEKKKADRPAILAPLSDYELSAISEPSIIDILAEEREINRLEAKRRKAELRSQKIKSSIVSSKSVIGSVLFFPIKVIISIFRFLGHGAVLAVSTLAKFSILVVTFPFKIAYLVLGLLARAARTTSFHVIFVLRRAFSALFFAVVTILDLVYSAVRFPFELSFLIYDKISGLLRRKSRDIKDAFIFSKAPENDFVYRKRNGSRLPMLSFSAVSACIFFAVFGISLFYRGMKLKDIATQNGQVAYASLMDAKNEIKDKDFSNASLKFNEAYQEFDGISKDVKNLGTIVVESSRFLPFVSKLSSGSHLVEAGKDISRIGVLSSEILETFDKVKNPLEKDESVSFLQIFRESDSKVKEISGLFSDLEGHINKIDLDDIPEEQRNKFIEFKKKLPEINKFLASFVDQEKIFADILGGNGPRKYLFLFQNNQEMRATGGFIGTYGILDIFDGHVKRFFIDGIFNPDGQLREKVVPPAPIQKISAAWSLHDSNWFPDFPKSAEKAAWFFEKTGGPTVDGVITMTPTVMQKMLEITGPIEMKEYGVTIDKDNFVENIQQEVEVDYDKDINQPKKILADLAPVMLDKLFNAKNVNDIAKAMSIIGESLNEKHILIYSKNYELENILSANGWSGEVLGTQKDYLSVINTNINGFKTDGVIDENIVHKAEIQKDGSIIDTVTIIRKHNGGDSEYDWWNKVNADYMRVYVPQGSKLLSASGQTREFNSPPIDYDALGFKRDSQVEMEEGSIEVDEETGTRIYDDSNKTVFGNWVYVSPQETATITYSYLLPFKIEMNKNDKLDDTYSLLLQKQSGSVGSSISSTVSFPESYDVLWKYPDEGAKAASGLPAGASGISIDGKLDTDKFIGIAFQEY